MGQSKRARRKRRAIQAHAPRPQRLTGWAAPVEVAAAAADPTARRRFKLVAYTGEPLRLYGFDHPVVIDCATLDIRAQKIPGLLDHMAYEGSIVGQIDGIAVGASGLPPITASGYFTPTNDPRDAGAFVLAKADAGFQWQASVGGDPGSLETIEAGKTIVVNGRTYAGPVIVAREVALREISFVVLGADRLTSAVLARRIKGGSAVDFATWVASLGFTEADLTEQQRAALQIQFAELYPAETPPEETPAETPPTNAAEEETPPPEEPTNAAARPPAVRANAVEAENRRIAANRQRIADIDAIAARYEVSEIEVTEPGRRPRRVNLAAHAIANNWDRNRTELEALRESRGPGPALISRSHDRDCTMQALQGAMLLRAGRRLDHPSYTTPQSVRLLAHAPWLRAGLNTDARQRAMEAAHRYASISAVDICREVLRIEGQQVSHDREEMIRAAFSTVSFANVFTTNVNAILLSTYMEATDTTQGWVREQEVADFRTNERVRLLKGPNLAKLPRGGEADHMTRSDSAESYKIARYAGQVTFDEQDVIDDWLGAINDVPVEMGLAAARLRPDLVYAILLANPTLTTTGLAMFSASNPSANLLTSAALAAATLRAAVKAQSLFQENNVNLNLMTSHILVPPSLRHLAYELVNSSQLLIAGDTDRERGDTNALKADGLTPVSDARLENGVTDPATGTAHSGSASTWYTVCNYAQTIEVGYLRGTGRAPRSRSWKYDREGKYGLGWDVSMDIGAVPLDWKGFTKSTQ